MEQNELLRYITGTTAVEIAGGIEAALLAGVLEPGVRLPTVRRLAERIHVSPTTVNAAFAILKRRGLLATYGRRGSAISQRPPLATVRRRRPLPEGVLDLSLGNPSRRLLPDLTRAMRTIDVEQRLYADETVDPELLERARAEFAAAAIPAQHVSVTAGALDGMQRVLAAHLQPGDKVAVEDPGFPSVFSMLAALGLVAVPIEVDASGPGPKSLEGVLRDGVQGLVVTPRAQNPTGAALDAERAAELRLLLERFPDVLVIEDDHAGPIAGAPAQSLCVAASRRWAVVRSVSKAYGPDLRFATMASDELTFARVEGCQVVSMRWVSFILQRLVVQLWRDPEVGEQIRRAREIYAQRRGAFLAALDAHALEAQGRSGLNVWISVPDEATAVAGLRAAGFEVSAGRRFRISSPPAVRVCIAELEPPAGERLARELAEIVGAERELLPV